MTSDCVINGIDKQLSGAPAWLTLQSFIDILKRDIANFQSINKYKFEPAVSTGENFNTVLLRSIFSVKLTDGSTLNISYVMKIYPKTEIQIYVIREGKLFVKERNTYNNLLPEFELMYKKTGCLVQFGPKIVGTLNEDTIQEVLILEDLCRRGFRNADRQQGLDMTHTKAVLQKLAQFHAASACHFVTKGPYPDYYNHCINTPEDKFEDYRSSLAKNLIDNLRLYSDARQLECKLQKYTAQLPDQWQALSPFKHSKFNVLNHGDCWINNVMFQYDAEGNIKETYFVDWQLTRYGPPSHDLYYLLLSSVSIEIKLKHFDYFIYYYHQNLIENLKLLGYVEKLPSLRDIHISLFEHTDWAYVAAVLLLPIVLADPSEEVKLDNFREDSAKAVGLKRNLYQHPRYVEQMREILPWMDNRGLFECR